MFSHTLKGYTIGYLLTRRAFRQIFGFPGFLIDALIIAPLFTIGDGNYLDFWKNCNWATYADNTPISGFFRPIFAWPGDLIGAGLGAIIGTILGTGFYIPDAILRVIAWTYDQIGKGCNNFAEFVATRKFFNKFLTFPSPENYAEKAWNISTGSLGLLVAAPFYIAAKTIEFVLPFLGNGLSDTTLGIGGFVSGIVGTIAALLIYPIKHACSKAVELFRAFRESVRSSSAFIYAKTDAYSWNHHNENSSFLSEASFTTNPHSQEFCNKLAEYKAKSTTEIIFGALKVDPQQVVPVVNSVPAALSLEGQYRPNPAANPSNSNDNDNDQPGLDPSTNPSAPLAYLEHYPSPS